MHPRLFEVPIILVALAAGGLLGSILTAGAKSKLPVIVGSLASGVLFAALARMRWGAETIPVQSYGVMLLIGFLCGVGVAASRAKLIGVAPHHYMDMSLWGIFVGLAGARAFEIYMNWSVYSPFLSSGFDFGRLYKWIRLWDGGLVFYGTFVTVIPMCWIYSRVYKLPALKFLDLAAPGLIVGQAFGRIGCFLSGCCYGKICSLPWAVHFPGREIHDSPAHEWHVTSQLLSSSAPYSLGVHPTQIYASLAAALTAGFLYAYWPRRKYDGQLLALMMIMAATTRFFEELLRDDDGPGFPTLSSWMTIAQWFALGIFAFGVAMMLYLRRSQTKTLQPQATAA
jgi:phosphatidylglycerol:prolipoprotein diacylglycerol transferase